MKLFEEPIVELKKFDIYDVLTTSDDDYDDDDDEPIMIGLCLGTLPLN